MTEAKYFKDYHHNYLILKSIETKAGEDYRYRMLASNKIGKILKCSVRNINGAVYFYYDISSKVTMENFYQGKKMSYEQVKDFFLQMDNIYHNLGEFFMEEDGLLLHPGFIYYDFTTQKYFGLYYPREVEEIDNSCEELFDFILNHIDNGNQRLVDLVYQAYDMSACHSFSLTDVLPLFEDIEDGEPGAARIMEAMHIAGKKGSGSGFGEDGYQDGIAYDSSYFDRESIVGSDVDSNESELYVLSEEADCGEENEIRNKKKDRKEIGNRTTPQYKFPQKSNVMFYIVFAILSFLGMGAMFWVYLHYELTSQEYMMVVCCALVLMLCFVFSLVQILLSYRSNRKGQEEEQALLEDIEDEFRDEKEIVIKDVLDKNMDMAVARSHMTGDVPVYRGSKQNNRRNSGVGLYQEDYEERYGQTVFLEEGRREAEYKLYALDKKNKKHIHLTQFPFTIGKMPGCVDCVLADDSISRLHARIEKENEKILLTDMNSMNGTYKNGLRMEPSETVEIEPGDEIRFGKLNYCYR